VPRLRCTFRRFLEIIEAHGFTLHRSVDGSHRIYRGIVGGQVQLVTFAAHHMKDEIKPGTLRSMISQSGLPKSLFRH